MVWPKPKTTPGTPSSLPTGAASTCPRAPLSTSPTCRPARAPRPSVTSEPPTSTFDDGEGSVMRTECIW